MSIYHQSSQPRHGRRVLIVFDPLLGHATKHVRGLIFRDLFKRNGWTAEYIDRRPELNPKDQASIRQREDQIARMSSGFDVVYLLKVPSLYLVKQIQKHSSAKVVFDLTDALWKPYYRRGGWQDLEKLLSSVDAVFSESGNEYICSYGRKYNSRVLGIPACTQVERFDQMRSEISPRQDGRIIIGWIGSLGTVSALESVREPLETLFARHSNLELRIVGCGATPLPRFGKVRFTTLPDYNEDDMIREVLNMDIGIFPPPMDLEDYRVRGALKAMIYMTGAVPAVCQNAGNCARIIQDGMNGMLARTDEEWLEKLEILVKSPEFRREMGQRALATIREEHSLEFVFARLEEALLTVIALPKRSRKLWGFPTAGQRILAMIWARVRGHNLDKK